MGREGGREGRRTEGVKRRLEEGEMIRGMLHQPPPSCHLPNKAILPLLYSMCMLILLPSLLLPPPSLPSLFPPSSSHHPPSHLSSLPPPPTILPPSSSLLSFLLFPNSQRVLSPHTSLPLQREWPRSGRLCRCCY